MTTNTHKLETYLHLNCQSSSFVFVKMLKAIHIRNVSEFCTVSCQYREHGSINSMEIKYNLYKIFKL